MDAIGVLPFGGCLLQAPLKAWEISRDLRVRRQLGVMSGTPDTYTFGEMVQFIRLLRGEIEMPPEIKVLVGLHPEFAPRPGVGDLAEIDVILAEASSPIEIVLDGFILQRNAIIKQVIDPIVAAHPMREVRAKTGDWFQKGLVNGDEDSLSIGADLAELVPEDLTYAACLRQVLRRARGRKRGVVEGLGDLVDTVRRPIGVITYVYQFMPNGRPISWPAGFRQEIIAAAEGFGLAVFEPWTLVAEFGLNDALDADLRHYRPAFELFVAERMLAFAAEIRDRARAPAL